jgi:hypothetical protein
VRRGEHVGPGDGGWGSLQQRVVDKVMEPGSAGGAHRWRAPAMDGGGREGGPASPRWRGRNVRGSRDRREGAR